MKSFAGLFIVLGLIVLTLPGYSQISPGKLSSAHEDLEGITNCTECHKLGEAVLDEKCLTCHTALRDRIETGQGYHSSQEVQSAAGCPTCHSEHHGRENELIFWENGRESLNHELTGWPLEGKHTEQDCRDCHIPRFQIEALFAGDEAVNRDETFLGLRSACLTCHEDEHQDQLTDNCLECHNQQSWTPAPKFDHQATDYPLTGRHRDLDCSKCHPAQPASPVTDKLVYSGSPDSRLIFSGITSQTCANCHTDPHQGRFGETCSTCHTTTGFSTIAGDEFDHDRTDFPLRGRHRAVECNDCHTTGEMTIALEHDQCSDCHNDQHRGQFADRADGGECDACHTVERVFAYHSFGIDNHKQTDYPLTGSHLAVPCVRCHTQVEAPDGELYRTFEFAQTTCQSCHDDIHRGQLDMWIEKGGCSYCHVTDTWKRTSFDHSLARFDLTGRHREILCLECHTVQLEEDGEEVVWMKPLDMTCNGCHTEDSPHAGQFVDNGQPAKCDRCHNPTGWKNLDDFNHNRDTDFALDGRHRDVLCGKCHVPEMIGDQLAVRYTALGTECTDCH